MGEEEGSDDASGGENRGDEDGERGGEVAEFGQENAKD